MREILSAGALPLLVDLAVLAHLHTTRAQVHNQVQFLATIISHSSSAV